VAEGDRYYPEGGGLETIGLKPQEENEIDEMKTTFEFLRE
jgi:hypothetical protein